METVRAERIPSAFDSPAAWPPVRRYDLHSAAFLALLVSGVCLVLTIDSRFTALSLTMFIISATAAVAVQHAADRLAPKQPRPQPIDISGFDRPAREMFHRAQQAIYAITRSDLYTAGRLDHQATQLELRRQERDLADRLSDIARLQASYDASCHGGSAGPANAEKLRRHWRQLAAAQESAVNWVTALEQYAEQVRRADAAQRDVQLAQRLEALDGQYLDLAARAAADEHATATISQKTNEVIALHEAIRLRT